jgi:prophage DNA circulation protein
VSNLNLNTIAGFQNLVGGAGTVLQSLTGAIKNSWDIQEGSYGHDGRQVLFHVFKTATDDFQAAVGSVTDTGGHRKIPVVFPYVDGQSTDDLGRKGESFDVEILLFGPNYKSQYEELLLELDDPRPGILVHPVRGQIEVAAEDWVVTHASDKTQAVALKVRFIEHNFSVDYSTTPIAKNVPSALTSAIGFLGKIADIITAVQSVEFVLANTKNLVASLISQYQGSYGSALAALNRTFNPDSSATIPGLSPTVTGQSAQTFNVTTTFDDVFTGTESVNQSQGQSQQLTAALATQQAIDLVSALRIFLEASIIEIEATENGQGALIFYAEILVLKQSAEAMQDVLELGIQTSNNQIIGYTLPRNMSVREVCFANGLSPDNSYDVEVLNPELLTLNDIPKGTIVQVPT